MSCGVVYRCASDLALLWLWRRPVAAAPIGPLAWEPPYAAGTALTRTKQNQKNNLTWRAGLVGDCEGQEPANGGCG